MNFSYLVTLFDELCELLAGLSTQQ